MPDFELRVRVEVDGQSLPGFPWLRRLHLDRIQGVQPLVRGEVPLPVPPAQYSNSSYKPFPSDHIERPFVLAVVARSPVAVRVAGEITSDIPLRQGGLLLVWNGLCTELPAGVSILNLSDQGNDAVDGFIAGLGTAEGEE